jgi:hypothetical protein
MTLYPTEQWLEAYGRRLDESAAFDDLGADWGNGFNGDVLLVIDDLPLAETTLGELPAQVLDGIPEDVQDGIADVTLAEAPDRFGETLRPSLPAQVQDLLYQIESHVVDGTIYAFVGLHEGACTGVELLEDPGAREVGFVIKGDCATWQRIVNGRPAAAAVLRGDLAIEGSAFRRLQNATVLQLLGDVAAEVETTHLFPEPRDLPGEAMLDEAVRQPVLVQRFAQRQAALVSKTFLPF